MSWPHPPWRNMPLLKYPKRRCCFPNYDDLERFYNNRQLDCITDGTVIINRFRQFCESETDFNMFHNGKVNIACQNNACESESSIDLDVYLKNPFIAECEHCNGKDLIIEYLTFARIRDVVSSYPSHLKKEYKWMIYSNIHFIDPAGSTACKRVYI